MSSDFIKIIVVIVIAAVFATVLRTRLPEYSLLLVLTVVCLALLPVLNNLLGGIVKLKELYNLSGNSGVYFTVALKALGIAYITGFAADVCRDFGLSALAQTAEIAGKGVIFILSIPLITAVIEAAIGFVGL